MKLFIAYLKKKLGIVSPSAWFNSGGKIEYEYDWIRYQERNNNG